MRQFKIYLIGLTKGSRPSQQFWLNFQIFECMPESG
ncbi:hypothetical protein Goshw_012679 [Gossypium schwendimanii]|uniref:Uncharacterized protein n=1 Tax=Gossypium schwendimanii TaxID=34291 RepID=A0A7J9L996_GOSSC|nr:hypothetical protein [Gossypium schwendimanii]